MGQIVLLTGTFFTVTNKPTQCKDHNLPLRLAPQLLKISGSDSWALLRKLKSLVTARDAVSQGRT